MTDATPAEPRPELPSVFRHPIANARGLRSSWAPVMGDRLARRYARMQLLYGLAIQFYVWGFVGGLVLVIIGIVLWGAEDGPALGATLGTMALFTGVTLYYCGLGSRRGATTRLLRLVRRVRPELTRGELNRYLHYAPGQLVLLAREHPEVFPPRD